MNDKLGFHLLEGSTRSCSQFLSKPFWSSEFCTWKLNKIICDHWDSNPGLLGEKRQLYRSAMLCLFLFKNKLLGNVFQKRNLFRGSFFTKCEIIKLGFRSNSIGCPLGWFWLSETGYPSLAYLLRLLFVFQTVHSFFNPSFQSARQWSQLASWGAAECGFKFWTKYISFKFISQSKI